MFDNKWLQSLTKAQLTTTQIDRRSRVKKKTDSLKPTNHSKIIKKPLKKVNKIQLSPEERRELYKKICSAKL